MGYPDKILFADETVLWHRRPHWKAVLPAALQLLILTGLAGMAGGLIEKYLTGTAGAAGTAGTAAIALYGVLAAVWAVLVWWRCAGPWWRWKNTHFVVTDRRVLVRRGILSRAMAELDLDSVEDVRVTRTLADRMTGAGTLVLRSAAADPVVLGGAPGAGRVQRIIRGVG